MIEEFGKATNAVKEAEKAELSPMTTVLMKAAGLPEIEDIQDVTRAATAVKRWKELEKAIEEYKPEFSKAVFELADKHGVKDEKGNATVTLPDGTGYKKEVRQTVSVDQETAVQLFRDKGLLLYLKQQYKLKEGVDLSLLAANLPQHIKEHYFDVQTVVPEESIEEAFLTGRITDSELSSTITKKVVNALKEIKPKKKK